MGRSRTFLRILDGSPLASSLLPPVPVHLHSSPPAIAREGSVGMPSHTKTSGEVTRREFTLESALAVLAGVTITITGCDDDNPTSPSDGVSGTISANHGHVATITSAQLSAGNALSLNIQGTATHPHTVTVSRDQIVDIAAGRRVTTTSTSNDGHTHEVAFN